MKTEFYWLNLERTLLQNLYNRILMCGLMFAMGELGILLHRFSFTELLLCFASEEKTESEIDPYTFASVENFHNGVEKTGWTS